MWVGIIQFTEDLNRTKGWGRANSLSSWAGTFIFSCSWTSELLVLRSSDSGTYTSAPCPQPFLVLRPLASGLGVTSSTPLVLRPSDSHRTTQMAFLILLLADDKPRDFSAPITTWANSYNGSYLSTYFIGYVSLENFDEYRPNGNPGGQGSGLHSATNNYPRTLANLLFLTLSFLICKMSALGQHIS